MTCISYGWALDNEKNVALGREMHRGSTHSWTNREHATESLSNAASRG